MMNRIPLLVLFFISSFSVLARDYFVGGAGASDNNPGTNTQPFATIQKAASVAVAGDVIKIRTGTYRETIRPNSGTAGNPIIFQPDAGATVLISGLNVVDNAGWTVHSGQIYKKSVTLPVSGYQQTLSSNTTIVANQVFKDGSMMIEARWPKISRESDLMDQHKWRSAHLGTNTVFNAKTGYSFQPGSITDAGLGAIPNLTGAKLFINGWFGSGTRTVNSHSGNQITFNGYFNTEEINQNFRKWWYVTNKLGLLTDEREWHYENGTLYFRQPGGGSPTGVEFKARNWGFDLRDRTGITVAGIRFIGCEVATGNTNTHNVVLDNVRARFTNHFVMQETGGLLWDITRFQSGLRLMGSNNVIKNSEFDYGSSQCIWIGANGKVINNKMSNYGYDGNYGAGVGVFGNVGNIEIANCTIHSMGRSAIDFGPNPYGTKFNLNIHHNDIYDYGKLNHDVGGIYTGQQCNTTGSVIHHNWVHDSGAKSSPTGHRIEGIQTAIYFDQGSGPATFHHNVCWKNFENFPSDAADFYILSRYQNRQDTPGSLLYNNTFASTAPQSYVTYITNPLDVQRNNIYKRDVVCNWGASPGNVANSLLRTVDPMYLGTGQGGLAYRLRSGSPGINTGVVIPGITDGSVGAPDIGAYEFGGTDWIPGYTAVAQTTPPTNTLPTGSITAPANNATFVQGAQINITATASDANGSVAKVEFFDGTTKLGEDTSSPYSFAWPNAAAGTHTLTIRVTDNENATATSTAVTITVTANASPTVAITAPANNAQVTSGTPISITATAADAGGTVTKVEFFDGTTKLGEDLSSPYTFSWTNAAAGVHVLTARATDNQTNVTTSTAVNITVAAPNSSPTVAITSPANSAQIASGSTITITATAADANGSVTKVEFFDGTTKLGEDLTSPYSFAWNNAAAGVHALTARATDNQTNVTTSAAVNITVTAANTPPTAAITSPSNGARLTSGSSITITATATDVNGSVTKVEFFDGTTKLGQDLTSPYSFIWNNAAVGAHTLTVKATDNQNIVTTSAAVNITLVSPDTAPTVSITGPATNTQFADGTPVTITATATDTNGSVAKVEFFAGNTKLGEDVTNTYSFTWNNIPAGTHIITVKATDNQNNVTTSSSITIVVGNANIAPLVAIAAPLENSEFTTGSSISITASASDSDGSVTKVEFFDGTTKLGEDLTAPYTFIWNNVAEGSYSLNAVATDNENAITTSESITVSVLNDINNPAQGGVEDLYSGIPRFFSPNGDGTGDYWEWTQPELFANSLLTVLNRSGQIIFEALSYNNTWDGTSEGQALQPGDYYYVIKMADLTELKGSVRILR